MKKHIVASVVTLLILLVISPDISLAADYTIDKSDTYYMSDYSSGDTINIDPYLDVTLVGEPMDTYTDFQIVCGEGTHLTIQDVHIDDSYNDSSCPISFKGTGNRLTLSGESMVSGGGYVPAILVDNDTEVTIDGAGSVDVQGGLESAGIGSGSGGIGGSISITGGTVNAAGGDGGAGIGGGKNGVCGTVSIDGDTGVTKVMAAKGTGALHDIGCGQNGSGGKLNMSGTAAVFMRNDECIEPVTTTHAYEKISAAAGGKVYGVPCSWTGDFGAYLRLSTLTYNVNGGSGTTPDSVTQHIGTQCEASAGAGLARTNYEFAGWDTEADGSGTRYAAGGVRTFSTDQTLHALWFVRAITADGTYPLCEDYSGALTINAGLNVTLAGTGDTLTATGITCNGEDDIRIQQLVIDDSGNNNYCPMTFNGMGNTLNLSGMNTLKGGNEKPAINVPAAADLTIEGDGTLNATGGPFGAAIGGGRYESAGAMTVSGGTIDAQGGQYGAGIGGGYGGGGTIDISGGTVDAAGGEWAAGIGGGYSNGYDVATTITISGGTVDAAGGDYGAGIGGGYCGEGTVVITDGTIVASGAFYSPGIGGGAYSLGHVTIDGGEVTATGGYLSSGIGDGKYGCGGTVSISGGTIVAAGGEEGAGIGVGCGISDYKGAILIDGGDVTATGGQYGAGIGNGRNSNDGMTITIDGGIITATGGYQGAGIGTGENGAGGTISISGGTIDATGGEGGAGIGGGRYGSSITISITDGTIQAAGGDIGAGIGGGCNYVGGNITISGGEISATGGNSGAGIGSGYNPVADATITIEGGTMTATGGSRGAGIGGCSHGDGTISITGGMIEAFGGFVGAGIGGSEDGSGGTISISGGSVSADGGERAAGIGGGCGINGDGGSVSISGGKVMASAGSGAPYDIGDGSYGSGGSLGISGTAAVFLKNDICIAPVTDTHTHESITGADGTSVFGVPCGWTDDFGAYLRLYTLTI